LHASSSEHSAELTSVSESSDDLTGSESSSDNPLSDLVGHKLGGSSSKDELSNDSWCQVPADSSLLVGLLEDVAGFLSLSESSDSSGSSPPSEPLAGSPLSHSSLSQGASLSLSHPGSDNFAPCSFAPSGSCGASGPSSVSSSPGGAGSVSSVPFSDDLGTSEVPSSTLASGPGSVSSLVDGAESVVSLESSDDSHSGSSGLASSPLSVTSLGGGALESSSVLESSDDSGFHVLTDLLLCSSKSVDGAQVSLGPPSSHDSGF